MRQIRPPWSQQQVAALNAYQANPDFHPFTYHDPEQEGAKVNLIATPEGWVAYRGGPVVQAWAHAFMAEPHPRMCPAMHQRFITQDADGPIALCPCDVPSNGSWRRYFWFRRLTYDEDRLFRRGFGIALIGILVLFLGHFLMPHLDWLWADLCLLALGGPILLVIGLGVLCTFGITENGGVLRRYHVTDHRWCWRCMREYDEFDLAEHRHPHAPMPVSADGRWALRPGAADA